MLKSLRRNRVAACLLGLSPVCSWASNGINMIGFGLESTMMGGADVAVSRDTGALNTNPAGLTQLHGEALDLFGDLLRTYDLTHKDSFGNDKHADNRYTLLGGGGYAHHMKSLPCTAGVGMFVQGGAGGEFKNLATPFGTHDDMVSLFGILKLSPGMGCQITPELSVGASVAITYASISQQKFFPNTSVAPDPNAAPQGFAGYELKGASTVKPSLKLGLQYRRPDHTTFGIAYTSKTDLPLKGGKLRANYSAMGLGEVTYKDAEVVGMALPQELAVGLSFKPRDPLLISLELNWLNWADAFKTVTITARNPDNSNAPPQYQIVSPANWDNQLAYAIGVAYQTNPDTTYYGGFNYGKNPIPPANVSPLLAGIEERHLTGGLAKKLSQEWKLMAGFEYMLPARVNYTSPLFGQAQVRSDGLFLDVMLSRRW